MCLSSEYNVTFKIHGLQCSSSRHFLVTSFYPNILQWMKAPHFEETTTHHHNRFPRTVLVETPIYCTNHRTILLVVPVIASRAIPTNFMRTDKPHLRPYAVLSLSLSASSACFSIALHKKIGYEGSCIEFYQNL
jgi:hypothetical protein